MSQYSVCWNSYKSNICNGLSSLQQQEEFVDLTLAADGHFVKVHQMIISLASPYLKELIKSAQCSHPVIFLNKISYPVLCFLLEYVYSGEVLVNKDNLQQLIEAGKALHIKGLEDMSPKEGFVQQSAESNYSEETSEQVKVTQKKSSLVDNLHKFRSKSSKARNSSPKRHIVTVESTSSRDNPMEEDNMEDPFTGVGGGNFQDDDDDDIMMNNEESKTSANNKDIISLALSRSVKSSTVTDNNDAGSKGVQYTLSNQGSLQLVLNRFVYFLRYAHKNSNPPVRQWRCVDYIRNRCPASVTTKDDIVVQRIAAHKHPFHDEKIVKKMKAGVIFTAIKDAETQGKQLIRKNADEENSPFDKE